MSDQTTPRIPSPCPECGGSRVICQTWEEGVLIPGTNTRQHCVPWEAHVCTICGYTSLYVTAPQRLVSPPSLRSAPGGSQRYAGPALFWRGQRRWQDCHSSLGEID